MEACFSYRKIYMYIYERENGGLGAVGPQQRADRAPPHVRRAARIRRWCGRRPIGARAG